MTPFYGQRVAQARQSRGLTRRDLAAALGVTVQTVRQWERGLVRPRVSILTPLDEYGNLLRALGDPASFFRMPPEPQIPLSDTSIRFHAFVYECDRCGDEIDGWLLENRGASAHDHPWCQRPSDGGAR